MRISKSPLVELKADAPNAPPPEQLTNDLTTLFPEARERAPKLLALATIAAQAGDGVVVEPGVRIKSEARAREKAHLELCGRYELLVDIAAVAVAFPTLSAAYAGASALLNHCGETVERVRDRFASPRPSGYSDISMNVRIDGHVTEVQLHVNPMLEAKHLEQEVYSARRVFSCGDPSVEAAMAGASVAVFYMAQSAVAEERELTPHERAHMLHLLYPEMP